MSYYLYYGRYDAVSLIRYRMRIQYHGPLYNLIQDDKVDLHKYKPYVDYTVNFYWTLAL